MLLGSVPSPPKKPKSSIRTQSARQSTTITMTVRRSSPGRPPPAVSKPAPTAARAVTASRFTAKPCAAVKDAKLLTHPANRAGCGVSAMDLTIPVSVPLPPCSVPCQKPRPGQACSTAMPRKKVPSTARMARPSCGVRQLRSGAAISAPAAQ